MNIAFLVDNNYLEQLAVTIASILLNDKSDTDFHFFVVNSNIENQDLILKLKKIKDFKIDFIKIDETQFSSLPTKAHLKKINYARLLFAEILPVEKVLFLDCDLIVNNDLNDLYNVDLKDNYVCAVEDRLKNSDLINERKNILEIEKYFNAGVMLLNLKKIKEDNIQQQALDFAFGNPKKLLYLEQCVLNKVFNKKIIFLDKTYNFQFKLIGSELDYMNYLKKNGIPKIIHFIGPQKPFYGYAHPFEDLYYKYLKQTPFKINYLQFKKKMFTMFLKKIIKKISIIFKIN